MLGRRAIGFLSTAYVELRFERASKWPERFSRSVLGKANPESLRETGVIGRGGNDVEIGDEVGEGGELGLVDLLVEGLSIEWWNVEGTKALNKDG